MPFLATVALSTVLAAQSANGIKVPFEKYTLPNGMKVILHVDKTLPVATINTWFYVASKDEPEKRSGFAHLFEHLMFMGTKRVPNGEFDQTMEKAGGYNNASTSTDRTNYFSFGPSNILPTLLWLDADRLEALAENMTEKKVDLQRDVVKNERRQNTENTPYGKAYEALPGLLFPKGHPYSTSVIGSHEDLSAASVQDVKDFFNQFYVPNNASLIVAGDFDPAKIKPLVSKLFGTLPRKNDVGRKLVQPFKFESRTVTMVDAVSAPKSILCYHTPGYGKNGDLALKAAGTVLSGGLASRLQQEVVSKLGLASEISAYQDSSYLGSVFYIDATVAEGQSQVQMERAIDRVVAGLAKSGPTADELKRVVASQESATARTLQSLDQKADKMNEYEFYYGTPDYFQKEINAYKAMTPAVVKQVVAQFLVGTPRLTLRVLPESAPSDQNPRDAQPAAEPAGAFVSPKPTDIGGIRYWSRAGVPQLTVSVHYSQGTFADPKGKEGLLNLATEMMVRGAKGKSASDTSAALDALGADLSVNTGTSGTTFSLTAPISNAAKALDILVDSILSPTLSASDFADLKDEVTAQVKQENDNPNAVARKVAMREFFGAAHPYARPASGTESSLKAITIKDVKAAISQVLGSGNTILAAGGISSSQAKTLLVPKLAKLKSAKGATYQTFAAPKVDKPRLVIVDRPNAVQTVISYYFPGLKESNPATPALNAATVILGGSFTSRLNQNLREDKGYTYGAGATMTANESFGFLGLSSSVRADVTGASLAEFAKELDRIQNRDITVAEAGKAQQQVRTSNVTGYGSLSEIVGTVLGLQAQGSSQTKQDALLAGLSKLSADALNEIASKMYDRRQSLIVLVGDKKAILEQIKGLDLPTPEFVNP
jgi:zinc protease